MAPSPKTYASTTPRKVNLLRSLLFAVMLASLSPPFLLVCAKRNTKFHTPFKMPKEDPYEVLGINKKDRNNMDAIKKAYREKAKAAHPDKNLDLDPEIANERFHRIVEAWDLLSDPQKKRNYDSRSMRPQNHKHKRNVKTRTQKVKPTHQTRTEQKKQREKEKQQRKERQRQEKMQQQEERKRKLHLAREAQDAVRKISSLEELFEVGIVDMSTQQFTKHFLCVFVSNKKIENIAEEEILFPYPFGPKGRNDIDWGNVIHTAKVRFNKATPLTKAFNVPKNLSNPFIVFARKGDRLDKRQFRVYTRSQWDHSRPNAAFERWMMDMLATRVTIKNRNPEGGPAIKIFIDSDYSKKNDVLTSAGRPLQAGYERSINVKLSDRLIILDASTNEFFGAGISSLDNILLTRTLEDLTALDVVVVTHEGQDVHVGNGYGTTRTCHDLSTQCHSWIHDVNKNACRDMPGYTHAICAKSCGVCIDSPYFNGLYYAILHLPVHKIPPGARNLLEPLRKSARFVRTVVHDFTHMWEVRRNVTFAFAVGGLLLGVQLVLLARMILSGLAGPVSTHGSGSSPSPMELLILMFATGFVATTLVWLSNVSTIELPLGLWDFQHDLLVMLKVSIDLVFDLFCLGFASFLVTKILTYRMDRRRCVVFLASMVSVTAIMVFGIGIAKEVHATDPPKQYKLFLWQTIWELRKNVAVVIIGFGQLFGATALAFVQFAKHRTPMWCLFATLVNIGVGCGLLSLTLLDPYFLNDLDHVVRMRMSAAIPCLVVGMLLGLSGAHLWFSMRDSPSRHGTRDAKVKID